MLLDKNNVNCIMECTSESLGAFLVSWCSSGGILPLRVGAASTNIYFERGADWCGQGKNNSFIQGCGRRRKKKIMTVTCKFWPKTPPPQTPHTNEKGVNLLRIQAAICLHGSHAK